MFDTDKRLTFIKHTYKFVSFLKAEAVSWIHNNKIVLNFYITLSFCTLEGNRKAPYVHRERKISIMYLLGKVYEHGWINGQVKE